MRFNYQMLKAIRLANNKTLEQFAKEIGRTRQAVHQWEVGDKMPTIKSLIKIINHYNIKIEHFFISEGESNHSSTRPRTKRTATGSGEGEVV